MKHVIANLRLSKKLLVGPLLVLLFFLVFGVISYVGLQAQQSAIDEIFNGRFKTYREAATIYETVTDVHGSTYKLIAWARANYDGTRINALGKAQLAKLDTAIAGLSSTAASTSSQDARERYSKALTQAGEYRKALFTVIDFAQVDLNTATMAMGTAEDKYAVFAETLHQLEQQENDLSRASFDAAMGNYTRVITLFFAVFAAGVAISLVATIFVNAAILAPIHAATDVINDLADGNLTHDVPVESADEVGEMAARLNVMIGNLRDMIGRISEAAGTMASASSQISSSTEEMAAGTQEQMSQTGEVASAVEEMAKTIEENSKNAGNTADTARQAKEAAERGGTVVAQTVGGMKRIAEVVHRSASTVQELGRSSDQIGEIISVIDDIADQTNLLALNAAIEAARAGEQGRGFAVVADEVRKLAERTTKATKEITDMIKKIQGDTQGAVRSMDEGTKQVEEGIKLADKAGASLGEIVEISQKVGDMVGQIAAASEEQSSAAEEISKNVEAISAVTGETAQGTHQIARAADDLNQLTERLHQLVQQFNLGQTQGERTADRDREGQAGTLSVDSGGRLAKRSRRITAFDFESAKNAHRLWRMKIQKLLMGKVKMSEEQVGTSRDCKLGKWYYGEAQSTCKNAPAFFTLGQHHEEMHANLRKVVKLWNDGRTAEAERLAPTVYELSEKVISCLTDLEESLCNRT